MARSESTGRDRGSHDNNLRLGKGAAFVKSQLKRLPQADETWEADFRALPTPMLHSATYYVGMALSQPYGFLLAEAEINQSPTVNNLATLLAHAMKRPLVEGQHRPRRILLRGNPRWKALFPALKEIGVEVVVAAELPIVDEAFDEFLSHMKKARSAGTVTPSVDPAIVEKLFPAIAKWVKSGGHIEIGDQESFGFLVRALDYGGLVFEDDKPSTLAEAMAALEKKLTEWFEKSGVD